MASVKRQSSGRWKARYRDAAGKEHASHFGRKVDAQRWLDETTTALITGQFVDPRAGTVPFRDYAEQWRAMQVHRDTSRAHVETMLRRHAYPTFGSRPIASILPSEVQAWVTQLGTGGEGRRPLAPGTIGVVHSLVSGVMKAAVRDRRIVANPCEGTKLPRVERKRVLPPTTEQVQVVRDGMPRELAALITFAAGTGMRQGECLGLTVDRIDFLRRTVEVDGQLVTLPGRAPYLAPPKTAASVRTIPLPQVVVTALAGHLRDFAASRDGLVFTIEGEPITRQVFGHLWRSVVKAAGLPAGTGFHSLRHYFASLLIRHGESVKTVQARLGHASAVETLDTYSHLWPDSDDRTREAVDSVLGNLAVNLRSVETSKT